MKKEDNISNPDAELDNKQIESLLDNVRQPAIDNSRIKSMVKEKMKYEKARNKRIRIIWSSISSVAAVALIVIMAIGFFKEDNISLGSASQTDLLSYGYKEINVPHGKRMEIDLSDGSHLVANYNTKVIYPEQFTGKERKIFVDGEVYIDVAKDKDHPFIVESPGFEIKVLGTKFNIDNRSDSTAIVVLVEGSIDLSTDKKQTIRLKPNDLVDVVNGEIAELRRVDAQDYISWVRGLRTLDGETMQSLSHRLEDYYGVQISCDSDLSETKIYGKLDLRDSLNDVLSSIKNIVPMEIKREGNTIKLQMGELN
ncbi:MAG: FecR domain-containing protein [Muribaculaceae bacterium]|nr:FecR domain-containing protein [Muribaculaceae bacterium]